MVEKLKTLLQQQIDGVLERIDEDEDVSGDEGDLQEEPDEEDDQDRSEANYTQQERADED